MSFKKKTDNSQNVILTIALAFIVLIAVGCLEEHWEPDDEVDTSGLEECDSPETWRCNGEVTELCRLANGYLAWRPMEDCSNIAGGWCEDSGDGSEAYCTGDYWETGYCPGYDKPASADCGTITDVGCCNKSQQNLFCDANGTLFCVPCWSDDYYSEFCTWDKKFDGYTCLYLEYGEDEIMEDPSGTTPWLCE